MLNLHLPVLRKEVVYYLNLKKGDIVFDGTLGGAGHTVEIIKAIAPTGKVIGADLDSQALSTATRNLKSLGLTDYVEIVNDNFSNVTEILKKLEISYLDGFFLDLGLSSIQIDISGRGFSYLKNQKLDMRFSEKTKLNAEYILNNYSEEDLSDIFYRYGEERWSARIARSIINFRHVKKLESTGELVEIIKRTIPAKYRYRGHPAKKIFQAIRIEVNSELENLKKALEESLGVLRPGGRIVIISYHSLEDRIVKATFEKFSGRCICPPKLPICSCGAITVGKIITRRAARPSENEVRENPRSKSAKLRAFEKI